MSYLVRLLRGNIRLLVLGTIATVSFYVSEGFRNSVQEKIRSIEVSLAAIDTADTRIADNQTTLILSRAAVLGDTKASYSARMDRVRALDPRTADQNAFLEDHNATLETTGDLLHLHAESAEAIVTALRQLSQVLIANNISVSTLPVETPGKIFNTSVSAPYLQLLALDQLPQLIPAMEEYQAKMEGFSATDHKGLMIANAQAAIALQAMALRTGIDLGKAKVELGLSMASKEIPPEKRSASYRTAALLNYQVLTTISNYLSDMARVTALQVSLNLQTFRVALSNTLPPLREKDVWLRYLSYMIAIVGFIASNMKPPSAASASVEADRLALAGGGKLALPHDAAAANDRPDRPAGHA